LPLAIRSRPAAATIGVFTAAIQKRFREYNSENIRKLRLRLIATRNLQAVPSGERAPSKPPHAPRVVQEGAWDRENGESRSNGCYSRPELFTILLVKKERML
jgi:hypothetical protein